MMQAPQKKTLILTGGNSGLGKAAAQELARAPEWHIVLACRNRQTAREAVEELKDAGLPASVEEMGLDLGSKESIEAFVEEFRAKELPPLHAIVCNAGIQFTSNAQRTKEGFEATFGVNHLGHFLLLQRLLHDLQAPGRIVLVSSGTHYSSKERFTGMPEPLYTNAREQAFPTASDKDPGLLGRQAYSTSKLCNVWCTYELDRRLKEAGLSTPESPLTVNAFDPGLMPGTGLGRDYSPVLRFLWKFVMPALRLFHKDIRSTRQSGKALARLVLDSRLMIISGKYFDGLKDRPSSQASYDLEKAQELWESSLELLELPVEETVFSGASS